MRIKEGHTIKVHTRDAHFKNIDIHPNVGKYLLDCLSGYPRIVSNDQDVWDLSDDDNFVDECFDESGYHRKNLIKTIRATPNKDQIMIDITFDLQQEGLEIKRLVSQSRSDTDLLNSMIYYIKNKVC
jgi:hypothetical protein